MIDGQKAGSGSARQPVIAPDSASSVTKLKIAVGLSEGEIEGFTRADIKLDGTPLTELPPDIVCDYRFGTNDQDYIPGIDEVANEIGVGVELRSDADWVKLITNQDIDHVGIRLRWGPLQTSHSNGDVTGVSIIYEIYIAPVGGSYERVLSTTLSDKTSDSYERYHEFKLPESDSGWMVRVVRVTPSAQSSLVSDKMFVQAYSEIIKSKFTFPYTSLVYLEYDAKTFSNVAKVAVNAKGLIIKVPSNYDPVTREYSGLWSGTFKMAYTNNPAWVYYDLVTNPRYGCGDRIDSSMVDKWSLYKLGQYCDQMVDDGYGGLEPRFTCNVYLQNKERAYDILNRLTGLFRAINFWNGSQLVVDADIPQDTSYLYTNANVVDGLFEYAGTAATDLYSAAKVAWDNPANGYNTEYEAVSYEHLVKKLGFKVLELDAWGCTSRGQALRAGRWALLAESDTVTFKVGMDGYLAMPGKIIEIQDEFYAGKSNGGRVISIDPSRKVITLDRPVTTIPGDTISFNTALEGIKKYNIVSSAGSVVTLSESIDTSIENMHIWAINSSQLATQKYRILTVKYDGVGEFTISAVEYNPNKYEEIDSNIKFDEPPTSIINPVAQAAVQNVVITQSDFIYQGLNTVNLEIKWDRAENAVEYLIELKKDDGSWLKLPVTGNNSITLENVYAGAYIARVIAVSAFELKSLPAYSIKTHVSGKLSAPQPPTNLRSVSIMFGAEFYWDFPPNSSDTAVSRIAVSYVDPANNVDESDLVIYDKAYSDNKLVIQNLDVGSPVWVKVKLIDKLGFESPYTDWVSGQSSQDVDKMLDVLNGHIGLAAIDAELAQAIDDNTTGVADAKALANQALVDANDAVSTASAAADAVAQEASDRATAMAAQSNALMADSAAKVQALKDEIDPKITSLQDGITQVTTDYEAADAQVVGQLNAYKTSNDSAVASVLQKAESAVATGSTNSSAITAINGQISTLEGSISTKADASALSSLTTRVTDAEGVNTSQGTAITNLQNTVNHATTGLATKASSAALTAVDNKVTAANGRIDTTNSNVTTLSGRVDTVEGAVANKAEAAALTALTTRVTNTENTNTSQGTAITSLQNTINHATTGLATKASAAALTATNSEVSRVDGVVTGHTNQLTQLTSDISTINGTLATKANASALNDYYTKTEADTNATTIAAGEVSKFKASLDIVNDSLRITGTKDFIDNIKTTASTSQLSLVAESSSLTGQVLRIGNNSGNNQVSAALSSFILIDPLKMYRIKWRYRRISGNGGVWIGIHCINANKTRVINNTNSELVIDSVGNNDHYSHNDGKPAFGVWVDGEYYFKGKGVTSSTGSGTLASPRTFAQKAIYFSPMFIANYVNQAGIVEIDYIIVEDAEAISETISNASAIQTTNSEVSRIDGVVSGHTTQLSNLTASIAGKANTSALDALTVRVTDTEGNLSTQSSKTTSLESRLNNFKAAGRNYLLDSKNAGTKSIHTDINTVLAPSVVIRMGFDIEIRTPVQAGHKNRIGFECSYTLNGTTYYYVGAWLNNASSVGAGKLRVYNSYTLPSTWVAGVSTFPSFFDYYNQTSGGDFTISNVKLEVGDAFTDWTPAPEDNASASAVESLTTRVTTAEGNISSEATKLSNLSTTVGGHTTSIATQTTTINGIQAKHTVKINNNGFVTGYGLISTANNGAVVSAFKVDADAFAVGKSGSGVLPFVVTTAGQTINGITYPAAGTWINSAYIANATIGTAHIKDLAVKSAQIDNLAVTTAKIGNAAITTAKIEDLAVTTAKIGDLQVDTLKIKDDAVSIGIGAQGVHTLSTVSNGGKIRLDVGIQANYGAYNNNTLYLRILRNGTVIRTLVFNGVETGRGEGWTTYAFAIICTLPPIIETIAAGTTVTYSIQIAEYSYSTYRTPDNTNQSWLRLNNISMAITELKK